MNKHLAKVVRKNGLFKDSDLGADPGSRVGSHLLDYERGILLGRSEKLSKLISVKATHC